MVISRLYVIMVLLIVPMFLPAILSANSLVLSPDNLKGESIGTLVDVYTDDSNVLTIKDIASKEYAAKFKPYTKKVIGYNYHKVPLWIRIVVTNPNQNTVKWYLENDYIFCDIIELYVPGENNIFREIALSGFVSPVKRVITAVTFIFPIATAPGTATYYLKCAHNDVTIINLKTWNDSELIQKLNLNQFGFGIFYGVMLVMFLYNLFIFFSLREKIYLLYLIKIIAFTLHYAVVDGNFSYLHLYLPQAVIDRAFVGSFMFLLIMINLFMIYYLDLKKMSRWIYRQMQVLLGINVLLFICFAILYQFKELHVSIPFLISLIMIIYAIVTSIVHIVRGSRMARFFLIAYISYLVGAVSRIIVMYEVVPVNFFTLFSIQIGIIAMMVLFSLGLADRINIMKRELADLNVNLEHKVAERTQELRAAMEELEAMNNNLTSTMNELEVTNEQLVKTRDALWGEMQLAKKIQTALLPEKPAITGFQITGYMNPADEVGGDYYDIINTGGRDWLVIGDVSGHGVPAGLVMMMVQTSIRSILVREPNLGPSELLIAVNKTIYENIAKLGETKYMTITAFACIDRGTFHFAGLHQDLIIYRSQKKMVEMIETRGMWVGVLDDITGFIDDSSMSLDPGDVLLLFTDGITEAKDKDGAMFSEERLSRIMKENGHRSPDDIRDAIIADFEGYDRSDDVTMVVIKMV